MARTGRPRTFDKDVTLARAMELFWSEGYGATSIQDLVDALQVERGSLYATFGDKRRFYLDTVKLYWAEYEKQLIDALAATPLLPSLREILILPAQLGGLATETDAPHGCLMGNTVAELVPRDPDALAVVTESFTRFTGLVSEALERAQRSGEVATTATPEAQAHLLLFLAQGVSLVSRSGLDAAVSTAAIDAAIAGLRA